jgi:hypothetical protein
MAEFNWYDFIKDFSPIIGIVIAALAYIYERNKDEEIRRIEKRQKKIDLIDTLSLSIKKVDTLLDGLKVDIEEKKYYAFKNINLARPLVFRLQSVIDEVIVFSNKEIIGDIIKNTDLLSQLIDDVTGIENYYTAENNKYQTNQTSIGYEFRAFELQLVEQNMVIENNKVEYISGLKNRKDAKLKAHQRQYEYLLNKVTENEKSKIGTESFVNDRRQALARNIIDVQTRLRELKSHLANTKGLLITDTTSWYKKILHLNN